MVSKRGMDNFIFSVYFLHFTFSSKIVTIWNWDASYCAGILQERNRQKITRYSNNNNNSKADFPQYSHSLIILTFNEYRYYNISLLLHSQFFFLSLFTFYLSSDHLQSKYAHPKVCSANPHYLSVL